MKRQIINFINNIFGFCIMYSVLIGMLVAIIYVIGFVLGGKTGETMALYAAKIMNSAITVATFGSVVGTIGFYVEGEHELIAGEENK